MKPPILLDLSRLVSRAGRPTPTGIDRIELAYAEHLLQRADDRLGFVAMNAAGEIAPLRGRYARLLVDALGRCWRDPDGSDHVARRLGVLARVSGLVPGRRLPLRDMRAGTARPVYLLVSHQNLHRIHRLARFKARSGAAFVFFVHDLIPMDYPEYARPGQAERHRQRVEAITALADGVVVNSQATADSLAPHLARAGRQIPVAVAHPGAEFVALPDAGPVARLGAGHAAHPGAGHAARPCAAFTSAPPFPASPVGAPPYFACIGTIEPRKNHLLLLHVWRQLAAAPGAVVPRLVLVGQRGWENENIIDMIDRCAALSGVLEEHNALPDRDLRPLLTGARALLCPAFVEGYGLPIAEALALGVPVICSDIPAFREVGRGVPDFIHPLDGLGWLRAIEDYGAAHSPRRDAQRARMSSWRAPRWDRHIDTVIDLIERVSAGSRPRPDPAVNRPPPLDAVAVPATRF